MSFDYLPAPVFLVVFTFFSIVLFLYAARIYGREKKIAVVGYGMFGVALLWKGQGEKGTGTMSLYYRGTEGQAPYPTLV